MRNAKNQEPCICQCLLQSRREKAYRAHGFSELASICSQRSEVLRSLNSNLSAKGIRKLRKKIAFCSAQSDQVELWKKIFRKVATASKPVLRIVKANMEKLIRPCRQIRFAEEYLTQNCHVTLLVGQLYFRVTADT